MKVNKKLFSLLMFVMLICCVSAASATDVDDIVGTEDADILEVDDAVDSVDVVEVDDAVDSVDIVEQDDSSDDVIEDVDTPQINDTDNDIVTDEKVTNNRGFQTQIVNATVPNYFDTTTGHILSSAPSGLQFVGNFSNLPFDNFIIDQSVSLSFANANFENVGFELLYPGLIIEGATFNINAPNGANCTAISVNANKVKILNNVINYTCDYANTASYNHVIKVVNSENVEVSGNNITAYLPLKDVDYSQPYPSIYTDLVAGVAVQSSDNFRFRNNRLLVTVSRNSTGYPTLDAFIIVNSEESCIAYNTIIEIDNKTMPGNNNYLYAIDVYQCGDSEIYMNNITLESKGGSFIVGTDNGTGAAYGIQLTGGHTGIVISNNNITTSNNGPNCGIYSQNYPGYTSLSITGNRINVTGNAGLHAWSLVTGMELGDDNDYVARNIIHVINKAAYVSTHNAYGISYSQSAMRHPHFNITNNTVEVKNGTYAVFIMSGGSGSVTNNCLNTTAYCCNNAVNSNPNVIVNGNYCPLGSNCHCGCNCTSHNNYDVPIKPILKSGDILAVSKPEILSAVNDELLAETECIIYVGENKTEDGGNGSYENPFATLNLAHASIAGYYDKITINIFNGTYELNTELKFNANELTVQGISGEVIIVAPNSFTSTSKAAFELSDSTSKFFMNNITFDGASAGIYGTPSLKSTISFFQPFYGEDNIVTYFNCTFIGSSHFYLIGPKFFNSNYINCLLYNFYNLDAIFYDKNALNTDSYTKFKNCIIIDNNIDSLTKKDDTNINFDGIWFGQNSIPQYVAVSPVVLTKYAKFSASETYIGNNQYEIVGKLTWSGTEDIADGFNPMTVTLSSSTGDIQASVVLVNGTFKAIYNSTSSSNLVNVVLDSVEIPLSFNSVDFIVNAPNIIYEDNQNITVTFPQIVSGNITVLVDGTPVYVGTINNDSIIIPVTDVLAVGIHNVNVTFFDAANHIYGFNTTSFTVSKVSDYDFNANITPNVYIGDNVTVTLSLPDGANGTVTVKVGDNEAKTFNVNETIIIGGFVTGENVVNIIYNGNDVYDAKSIVKNISALNKPTITIPEIDAGKATTTTITLPENATGNVTVFVDGKEYSVVPLTNGSATVTIPELPAGKHNVTISYSGDGNYSGFAQTSAVEVKEPAKPTPKPDDKKPVTVKKTATKITAKKKTFKAKTKVKKYTITLKAGKKAVKKVQVILKIGKKTFKAKTNAKGKATFKIKKLTKKGKYTAKITFKGNKLYKATTKKVKITVKK